MYKAKVDLDFEIDGESIVSYLSKEKKPYFMVGDVPIPFGCFVLTCLLISNSQKVMSITRL